MKGVPTRLRDVVEVRPRVFTDARGYFVESYNARSFSEHGIDAAFVQDNLSYSVPGALRGLHLQHPHAQGKLITVPVGRVLDVAVDVRRGSPTFGEHVAVELAAESNNALWVPAGFAHGYCVIEGPAICVYKCTDFYFPAFELRIAYDDPDLGIDWPSATPLLSEKDADAPRLREVAPDLLPVFEER